MIILRHALDRRVRVTTVIRALLLMICITSLTAASAQAQVPAGTNNVGKPEGASIDPNSNNMSAWATRDNYFKRFPFAASAYQHDRKSIHHKGTVENPGNNSFLDGLFGGGEDDFSSLFGGGSTPTQQPPVERLQQSDPPAAGQPVTAYPFYIKFCNDNPYQGVCYWQMGEAVDTPAAARDMELFENVLTTFGYPVSDTQFQIIQRENFQRLLELLYDPERNTWMMTNTAQIAGASASNSLASGSENAWNTCIDYIMEGADGTGVLINVANERSATPIANPNVLYKRVSEAVYMVQRMYRECFVPMAILFLLPGAVVTQVKSTVRQGFSLEQTPNPFEGILRSIIAVFLIPATQVIVSYSIDVGNSMADAVKEWVDIPLILDWSHELTYNVTPQNHKNVISPPDAQGGVGAAAGGGGAGGGGGTGGGGGDGGLLGSVGSFVSGLFGGLGSWFSGLFGALMAPFLAAFNGLFGSGGDGIAANIPEAQTIHEDQLALSQAFQAMVNGTVFFVSLTIIMLTAFQLVFICYLYLLGPLSAAMFAWPIVSSSGYFRAVFGKWVEAVICISLWRFYWVVCLAIMTQRLIYIGGGKFGTGDLQWEAIIFCCALGLMLWAAMNPFIYDPSRAAAGVESTVQTGKSMGGSGGGGGGEGGGDGGGGGAPSGGGGDAPQIPDQGGAAPEPPATATSTTTSSAAPGDLGPESGSDQPTQLASRGGDGLELDGGGDDSSAPPTSSGSASQGPDGSTSPDTSLPPSAAADGGTGAPEGGGDSGGGGGGGDTEVTANLPPSADGGSGDGGAGGGDAAQAALDCGLPPSSMPSDGPPVALGPSDSGSKAICNDNADYGSAAAAAAAQGATGGGGGGSDAGGQVALSVDVSGAGGDDSGGGAPPSQAPPVPPPPSFGEEA